MKLAKEEENLKDKTIFITGNTTGHGLPIGYVTKITIDTKPRTSNGFLYYMTDPNLSHIRNIDFSILDDEEIKIFGNNNSRLPKLILYKANNNVFSYRFNNDLNSYMFVLYRKGMPPLSISCVLNVTDNCQICAFRSFNITISSRLTKDDYNQLFTAIYSMLGKALMIIDINSNYESNVDSLFKTPVIKQRYCSSNGSNMIFYLVNINLYITENKLNRYQHTSETFNTLKDLQFKVNSYKI